MTRRTSRVVAQTGDDVMALLSRAFLIGFAALAACGAPVAAEVKVGSEPAVGVERTVTVGSVVSEHYRYEIQRFIIPRAEISQRVLWAKLRIRAGEELTPMPYTSVKLKACGDGGCGLDDDGDGTFDRIAMDDTSTAIRLATPVAYDQRDIPHIAEGNFRQIFSYMGATSDTLRLSYREFANDMARPAFTEELSLPLGKTFPQKIAFKDVRMTILSIDGMGMRYRIEP